MDKINTLYNGYSNIGYNSNDFCKEHEDQDMPDAVKNIISLMKSTKNYDRIEDALFNAVHDGSIKRLDSFIVFNSGDYYIETMFKLIGEDYSKTIEALSEKNIKIAPEYITSSDMSDDSILVTKISGTNGKDLIPLHQGYNLLDDEAKKSAYADVQKLIKMGVVNQDMLKGDSCWYITPDSKQLVIPDWHHLRPIDADEGKDILNSVHAVLFKK